VDVVEPDLYLPWPAHTDGVGTFHANDFELPTAIARIIVVQICPAFSSRPALAAARSIIRAKPAVVNGDSRSLTKTNGDVSLSRWSRRRARSSSPREPIGQRGERPCLLWPNRGESLYSANRYLRMSCRRMFGSGSVPR
jgi:hypothetical protein